MYKIFTILLFTISLISHSLGQSFISRDTVDFGAFKYSYNFDQSKPMPISITNTTNGILKLASVTSTNSIFSFDFDPAQFPNDSLFPSQTKQYWIRFATGGVGYFSGLIVFEFSIPAPPETVFVQGTAIDTTMYRTIKNNILLSKKPAKFKFIKVKGHPTGDYPVANVANVRDTIMLKLGYNKKLRPLYGLNIGKNERGTIDINKVYWIRFMTGTDISNFFTSAHTGKSYPLDSLLLKTKKLKMGQLPNVFEFTPTRKNYNNPLIAEFTVFKLNYLASSFGITPVGFGDLEVTIPGSPYNGLSLYQLSNTVDSMLSYWKNGITPSLRDSANAEELKTLLQQCNNAFADTINAAAMYHVTNAAFLRLNGTLPLSAVTFLKNHQYKQSIEQINPFTIVNEEPAIFELMQNYPNPFNPTTIISYSLPVNSIVSLKVFNILGQEVATLLNNEEVEQGSHEIEFNASNLSSGVYFYRLNVNNGAFTQTKKLVLMK